VHMATDTKPEAGAVRPVTRPVAGHETFRPLQVKAYAYGCNGR
jgi:hypothetical protein